MRTAERTTTGRELFRDVGAISVAMLAVGASFGAIAVAAGLSGWATVAMSTLLFAGGAQFVAVGLIAAGSPFAAILAGLLLNARHLPFGLALGDTVGTRWPARLVGSHLMTDEATAFALAQPTEAGRRRAYWLAGTAIFVCWNLGTVLGVLLGGATGDPAALGLDAAFPAGLLALLMPALRDRETRRAVLAGAVIALLVTPLLPAGLPVLVGLSGLAVLALPHRRPGRGEPSGPGERMGPGERSGPGERIGPGGRSEAGERIVLRVEEERAC